MVASTFDLFKIGVGPSSSHTMGPMTAAADFVDRLNAAGSLGTVARVDVALYGSLALTGQGHATDRAVLLGLSGERPATLCPDRADATVATIRSENRLNLGGTHPIAFEEKREVRFLQMERLPFHSNAMRFAAYDAGGEEIASRTAYSVGGGAVVYEEDIARNAPPEALADVPHSFCSGAMSACIDRGVAIGGILPGGLNVKRRAPGILKQLVERQERALADPLTVIDWVNLWALAVNEENAAGGKVVTAPTNGAAGIVPAVLRYYERFAPGACKRGVEDFLLTAAAIGSLFKENASISGAEVGCQGEVGVACSMAAAGLAAALGATPMQVENAAEIGMEHNLGLTCDPVAGLVQVPCIERNAVGSIKAIEAARLAMLGDGTHRVSLDQVIETMRRTGLDMSERYKETSLGGLAVNVVEC